MGCVDGRYWWAGRNLNGVSQRTISYKASKDLILVNIVQLNPMINSQSLGRIVSSGISDADRISTLWEKPSEEVDDEDNGDYYYCYYE